MMKPMCKNEIAFESRDDALIVASKLLDANYVVMVSNEENLTIVNYEWSCTGDRNDVVFMSYSDFEHSFTETSDDD